MELLLQKVAAILHAVQSGAYLNALLNVADPSILSLTRNQMTTSGHLLLCLYTQKDANYCKNLFSFKMNIPKVKNNIQVPNCLFAPYFLQRIVKSSNTYSFEAHPGIYTDCL